MRQVSFNDRDSYVTEIVKDICKEIRAMNKDLRNFLSKMLIEVKDMPVNLIIQMAEKESTFQQKFVAVGQQNQQQRQAPQVQNNKNKGSHDGQQIYPEIVGIFLLLIEDDSMSVRISGIDLMSKLAQKAQEIRQKCLNFLIDMLNDEIDEVRIGALHGIANFNDVSQLNEYEVNIVLFNLNEDNQRLRDEIYLFFGRTIISKSDLFLKLLYKLGQTHSQLVSSLVFKILGIDKRFQAIDPIWTDVIYIANMILIYAASLEIPSIFNDVPQFVEKSLNYLKDQYKEYYLLQTQDQKPIEMAIQNNDNQAHQNLIVSLDPTIIQVIKYIKSSNFQMAKKLTENSLQQVKSQLKMLTRNSKSTIDHQLAFFNLLASFIQSCFRQNDVLKSIDLKMKMLLYFQELPGPFKELLEISSLKLYLQLIVEHLDRFKLSDFFYEDEFITLCQNIIAFSEKINNQQATTDPIISYLKINVIQQKSQLRAKEWRNTIIGKLKSFEQTITMNTILDQININQPDLDILRYSDILITHPLNTHNEVHQISYKHSEFMTIQGNMSNQRENVNNQIVVRYPDDTFQFFQTRSNLQNQEVSFNQKIEIKVDKSWNQDNYIEIFFGDQNVITDEEVQLILELMPLKKNFIDKELVRFDNGKLIGVKSNMKKYLIKPC
ncbi:integrator complex subunit 4 [Stylonychia lemnae]|uniref:Integrator complex subunit 4 n=1 Tax=Stylonychia lemnae TaxID=5949 RepID=A0A078APE2_STYLE|nr:integrator complex subunit 4 [Stylonychia lemnae]|eukprot:CDW84004.1 integrator complex subunit 4 [Stylonychia lemnae]